MVKVQRLFAKTNVKIRVCGAKQNNESPSGAFKRQNGLAQQDGGASPRQVLIYRVTKTIHPSADNPKTVVRFFAEEKNTTEKTQTR